MLHFATKGKYIASVNCWTYPEICRFLNRIVKRRNHQNAIKNNLAVMFTILGITTVLLFLNVVSFHISATICLPICTLSAPLISLFRLINSRSPGYQIHPGIIKNSNEILMSIVFRIVLDYNSL